MNLFIIHAAVGALSGLHSSCWGAYKDSIYEKFKSNTFLRSIIVGFCIGLIGFWFLKWYAVGPLNLGIFFVSAMTFERLFTETLKAFFREEQQDKYRIPSRFHIFGHIVHNRVIRWLSGICFIALALFFFTIPSFVYFNFQLYITGFIWGFAGGLFGSAFGGAWKDAPIEGFFPGKFLRSPLVAGIWGIIFSFFTQNPTFFLIGSIGAERMTVEFCKTFLTRHPPGKFKEQKPQFPEWIEKRKLLITPYFFTWIIFLILLFVSGKEAWVA